MFVSHLYVFFGEMCLFSSLALFFGGVTYFSGIELQGLIVYFWDFLSVALFAIIFSHCEGCLFTLLIVSFVV